MAIRKTASKPEKPKRAARRMHVKDDNTLSRLLWNDDFFIGGTGSYAKSATSPSARRKTTKTTTRKAARTKQTTDSGTPSMSPAAGKVTGKKKVSSAKKASVTPVETDGSDTMVRTEPEKQTTAVNLHDVKILMDENSQLALLQVRESFKDLLEPLNGLRELIEKIDSMKMEIQNLEENIRNLRNMLDDGLEEVKQSIRHSSVSQ